MADEDINISSGWNGIVYTAAATDGKKFGSGSSIHEDEARAEAVKDLKSKGASREAPETGGGHSTADPEAEREAAKNAGKTGDIKR